MSYAARSMSMISRLALLELADHPRAGGALHIGGPEPMARKTIFGS